MTRRMLLSVALLTLCGWVARAQTTYDDKFFDAKGVRIHYIDVGRGEPVVLVHGFSSSIEGSWGRSGVIAALDHDFRVVALDCRGHGQSDKPHKASAYGNEMVEDITRLMDHLSIPRAHIMGYSMGGAITGRFVALHPTRVISATFGGSTPRIGWSAQNEADSQELATSLEQGHGMRPLVLRLLPPNEPKPSDAVIDQQATAALGRNDALALAMVQRADKQQQVTVAQVKAMKMPMQVVIGSADPILARVSSFKALVPDVHVVVIEGATHAGDRGAPGRPEFKAAVHDFLQAHKQ